MLYLVYNLKTKANFIEKIQNVCVAQIITLQCFCFLYFASEYRRLPLGNLFQNHEFTTYFWFPNTYFLHIFFPKHTGVGCFEKGQQNTALIGTT